MRQLVQELGGLHTRRASRQARRGRRSELVELRTRYEGVQPDGSGWYGRRRAVLLLRDQLTELTLSGFGLGTDAAGNRDPEIIGNSCESSSESRVPSPE